MKVYNITFSPTGGTKKVADLFTEAFTQESSAIDLTDNACDFSAFRFQKTDVCIVAVPSYGGRVPEIAVKRLKQMEGNGAKAILIAVYGNRAFEDTLLELRDTLHNAEFHCIAAIGAIAEHSIMHQFAPGRPDANDAKELAEMAEKIRTKCAAENSTEILTVPGNRPYREYGGVPMKPKAGKSCIKCGLCVTKCPVGAIPASNPLLTDKAACISCMRCIAICPNKARKVSKVLLTAGSAKMKDACSDYKKNQLFL